MKARLWMAVAAALAAALVADSARAENKYDYCLLCHGANGNGNYGIRAPKISGLEPWYLSRQLENFAAGSRGVASTDESGHEMGPVALRLKNQNELAAAVAFVGTLESHKPAATVKGDVARGQKSYAACAACHGAKGEGNAALQAPALAARSDWYLITQLANYKAGLRGTDEKDIYGAQMRAIAATLADDAAIRDLAAYINTL